MRSDTERYRALTTEFLGHLKRHGHVPHGVAYQEFMFENGKAGTGTLTDLMKGATLPEKAAIGLINMLLKSPKAPPGSREALLQFLEDRGVSTSATDTQVFNVLCGPVRNHPEPAPGEHDYLKLGAPSMWNVADRMRREPNRLSRSCRASECAEATTWIQVLISAHAALDEIRKSKPIPDDAGQLAANSVTVENAQAHAESHMGVSTEAYTAFLRSISERHPPCVRVALGARKPLGVTVVLPLKPDAYARVRDGEVASYECGPDDITLPSQHILIEAVAERLGPVCKEPTAPTKRLLFTLLLQLAHFTRYHEQQPDTMIHVLSFAGTSESAERLRSQGFEPTKHSMPRSGVAILERKHRAGSYRPSLDFKTTFVLTTLSRWLPFD